MPPQWSDFVLTAHVPHSEADIPVLDRLDVESDRGYGGDNLAELQLVEYSGFTGSVQTHHQYSHLLLAKQSGEHVANCQAHLSHGVGSASGSARRVAQKLQKEVARHGTDDGEISVVREKIRQFSTWFSPVRLVMTKYLIQLTCTDKTCPSSLAPSILAATHPEEHGQTVNVTSRPGAPNRRK